MTCSGFKLVKQNRFAKIYERNKKKGPPKRFFGFVNHFLKNVKGSNPLSANITKWSNTLKQLITQIPGKLFECICSFCGIGAFG